jgi:putative oxidoreductase
MLHTAFTGLDIAPVALSVSRIALGSFFAISGFHKLFNRRRHEAILKTMVQDGIPKPKAFSWIVPAFEFNCGLSLIVGFLSPLAAFALFVICFVAICTDGMRRIPGLKPIDRFDWLDDFLYLPETLYLLGLFLVIAAGPGSLSIDALLVQYV